MLLRQTKQQVQKCRNTINKGAVSEIPRKLVRSKPRVQQAENSRRSWKIRNCPGCNDFIPGIMENHFKTLNMKNLKEKNSEIHDLTGFLKDLPA